jgi:hypothetical protein
VASFFLEVAFSVQKATSKLLNNAFYATLCCQIKKLPWSDPALTESAIKDKMLCIRVDFNRVGRAFGPVDRVTASVL